MQDIISLIILGVVQGLTEFLPVSSTGHLILAREFFAMPVFSGLGINSGATGFGLAEDAVLHLATALAVLVYFRSDILNLIQGALRALTGRVWNKEMTVISALIIGTIPAVVFGLWLESSIETVFRSPAVVAGALIVGSIIFVAAEYVNKRITEKKEITIGRGLAVGFFQVLALIPGMSRSGMTISGGMFLGLTRVEAARFAFLLSFPIILGAGGLQLMRLIESGAAATSATPLIFGAIAAFISGMIAIHALITILKKYSLMPFVVYRLVLAGVILLLAL